MNITKEKLTQLLSEAFDEGMAGYLELKESFLSEMVEKFDQDQKKSPLVKSPVSSVSSMGTSYTNSFGTGSVVPSYITFDTAAPRPDTRSVIDEPMIVNGHIGGIDIAVPTNVQDFRNIEINWNVEGVGTVTGTWDYLHSPAPIVPTPIVVNNSNF